jgi:glycosyltransferase 2 family protein
VRVERAGARLKIGTYQQPFTMSTGPRGAVRGRRSLYVGSASLPAAALVMTVAHHPARRTLIVVGKIALAAAILGYLLVQVQKQAGFARLIDEPKAWHLLAIGLLCTFGAVALSFVRWHVLLTALGLPFRLRDTMRLGALGFALNFVSLGSIGGDLFKAIFVAKDSPGRRTEAVATVVVDRLVGVSMMLTLASVASFCVDWSAAPPAIRVLVQTIRLATVGLVVGVTLILAVPALSGETVRRLIGAVPLVGPTAARLIGTVSVYRDEKRRVLLACSVGMLSNTMFILSFFFIAQGLPVRAPTLAQHFVIVPTANMAGAIPATPSGLGTMELAMDRLYQAQPVSPPIPAGDGTLVALGQRATMILVAALCLVFYVMQRGDLREVIHEVEEAEAAGETL